ncbi:MAG: DUF47 domain-containing protein [Promethearchaeota archaeon]
MSLKHFLQSRNNANTLELTIEHLQKTLETLVEFERGFAVYHKEDNRKLAFEIFRRVDRLEHDCDILRREIMIKISKSQLTPQMREDLTHLVKRIDRIANVSDGAARRIMGLPYKALKSIGDSTFVLLDTMITHSVKATKILFSMVKRMSEMEDEEIFKNCERIQELEHKCDILHSSVYEELNKLENIPFNHFVALQISNLVDMIETISDKVEDVSDYIEVIKAAQR